MGEHWYALRSKPNKEEVLWQEMRARGYETFYPRLSIHPVNPRSRKVKPYFPSYLFVRLEQHAKGHSALARIPYSYGLVSFGPEPSSIPDELIQAIRQRIDQVNSTHGKALDRLRTGDSVVIQNGSFKGYQAIFNERLSGSERVRVLLIMIGERHIPLELPADHIQQIKSHLRSGR